MLIKEKTKNNSNNLFSFSKLGKMGQSVVAYAFNFNTWKAEANGFL